jgi:hypothetical protein
MGALRWPELRLLHSCSCRSLRAHVRRRRTARGWVVRLTDAPLDLDNPAHLDALLRAYERFPEIGWRSTLEAGDGGQRTRTAFVTVAGLLLLRRRQQGA